MANLAYSNPCKTYLQMPPTGRGMRSYKYFGNAEAEVGLGRNAIVLKKFAQQVMLSDDTARDILNAGGGILLAEDFDRVGFSPIQIKDKRERKGEAYMEKHRIAFAKMVETRDALNGPPPLPEDNTCLPLGRAEE